MKRSNLKISDVKENLMQFIGKDISMEINKGRNRLQNFDATIIELYPSVFTVKINSPNILDTVSYSYTEILCGAVKIAPAKK